MSSEVEEVAFVECRERTGSNVPPYVPRQGEARLYVTGASLTDRDGRDWHEILVVPESSGDWSDDRVVTHAFLTEDGFVGGLVDRELAVLNGRVAQYRRALARAVAEGTHGRCRAVVLDAGA